MMPQAEKIKWSFGAYKARREAAAHPASCYCGKCCKWHQVLEREARDQVRYASALGGELTHENDTYVQNLVWKFVDEARDRLDEARDRRRAMERAEKKRTE